MSRNKRDWSIRLTHTAEHDFHDIVECTATHFGTRHAEAYALTLSDAVEALLDGPDIPGVRVRDDILPGLFSLHVNRCRRKGRHIMVFRVGNRNERVIEVLRLLHDAMEVRRYLPQ